MWFKKKYLPLAILISFLLFAKILKYEFINLDDVSHIDNHPNLGVSSIALKEIWEKPYLKLYIPLTYTVWGVLAEISPLTPRSGQSLTGVSKEFKYQPFFFHFANLILHLGSVGLVSLILNHYFKNTFAVFLGVLLFALHPVQVEPVVWVSGLKDTLSGFLFFLSFYLYLKNKFKISLFVFFLSLLAKPTTLILPWVLWVLSDKKQFKMISPFILLSLPFAFLSMQLQSDSTFSFPVPPYVERVWIALDAIGFYLYKILFPYSLGLDYGRNPSIQLQSVFFACLGLVFLFFFFICKKVELKKSILLFLIFLLPYLGLKPFVFQTTSTVSDRYLYLALFAFAYGMASFKRVSMFLLLLPIVWVILSWNQMGYWKNTETILTHALEVNPKSWLALNNLGAWYEREGKYDLALEKYEEAAQFSRQSVFYNNRGVVFLALKRYSEARKEFAQALEINPYSEKDRLGLKFAEEGMEK